MGKRLLLASVLTLYGINLFGQSINGVSVLPQNPTSSDEVMLDISGDRWSSDMYISSITVSQNFNTWNVDIEFMTQGIGLPVVLPFDTIISLGMMDIGYYDCQVNGIFDGSVQDFDGTSWAVLEPVGVNHPIAAEELKFICSPNPIVSDASLNISVPTNGKVTMKIYDVIGQEIATVIDKTLSVGVHQIKYLAAHLPAGRYYFHLTADGKTVVKSVLKR